jgi:hypothetical protein
MQYSTDELCLIDKQALRALLSSPSLIIESEDFLLRSLIGLGKGFSDVLDCVEIVFLSDAGICLFVDEFDFNNLTSDVWGRVCGRLKGDRCESVVARRLHPALKSTILTSFPSILTEFRWREWRLLYRGTVDGFSASSFHVKCNNCSHTITLISTTTGFIFGGFTPIPWDSSGSYKFDSTGTSFIFSLVNPRNAPSQRFPLTRATYAVYCVASYGPTFGDGHDIYIANTSNANTSSYSNLGSAYENETGVSGTEVLAGQRYFTVKEIDVFSLGF